MSKNDDLYWVVIARIAPSGTIVKEIVRLSISEIPPGCPMTRFKYELKPVLNRRANDPPIWTGKKRKKV